MADPDIDDGNSGSGVELALSESGSGTRRRTEVIRLNEAQDECGFLIKEESTQINIYPSRSNQKLPESKVRVRTLVDYNWDVLYGSGRTLAAHISGKFIAYVLKVTNSGGVRIVDLIGNDRVLIKGSRGMIKDVEFMHKIDDLIIAFIDEYGTVYVYKITKDMDTKTMKTFLILEINMEGVPVRLDVRRFIWCKYVPDGSVEALTPRDGAYHFAILQNDVVYVSNLCQLIERFGEGQHTLQDFKGNYMVIDNNTKAVVDAAFSPDGTALATSSLDGTVKFFQIYLVGEQATRCLYSWQPHDGRPVTKIFFLDDHSMNLSNCNTESEYFWKYMLTAGPNMSEIKLWACRDWVCLQTLKFSCPSPSQLKLELDITSNFLVISDVHRKSMFVMSLKNEDDTARFRWISEFSLPCSMLSFHINSSRLLNVRQIEEEGLEEYVVNELMDAAPDEQFCVLDISYVQPKSLQQGTIGFRPPKHLCQSNAHSPSRISFDTSISYIEGKAADLSDSPINTSDEDDEPIFPVSPIPKQILSPKEEIGNRERKSKSPETVKSASPKATQPSKTSVLNLSQQLSNLLLSSGPSFSNGIQGVASNERARSLPPVAATVDTNSGFIGSPNNHIVHGETIYILDESPPLVRPSSRTSNASRASSSPSREVEEILSPKTAEPNIRKGEISQPLDEMLTINNFDVEGNVVEDNLARNLRLDEFLQLSNPGEPKVGLDIGPMLELPQVLEQVSSIMEMMQAQAIEMRELKREVSRLNITQSINSRQLDESTLSKILEKYFSQNSFQVQRLDDSVKSILALEKQRPPPTQALPANFGEVLTSNIGRLLKMQIETIVVPSVLTLFAPLRDQVQAELVKLVINAEGRIKQELKQILQSPEFKNSITSDVETNMKTTCEAIIPRVLLTSIVPNFEKSLQSMYVKINDTFLKGTKEYIGGLEGTLGTRRAQEISSQEEIKDQLTSMQDNISSVLQVELESQMLRVLSNLQTALVKQIEETVVRELGRAFRDQQKYLETSVFPRAVTPALSVADHNTSFSTPPVDPEVLMKQMFKLAERGDIAGAFVQASRYSDITYMMKLAEKINPTQVFNERLPTQIHVAIIQQMASDMMLYTETKIEYLNVALSSLNPNTTDKKILKSLTRIVPVFQVAVKKYAEHNPGSPNLQKLRLLEMAFLGVTNPFPSQ